MKSQHISTAEAQRRLQRAFDRLEAAARRLRERAATGGDDAVRAERDRLAEELARVRADYDALERVASGVERHVDEAITRLEGTLER